MPFVIGFLALWGESASAQFLSSVEVGAGWRQERILSWPHRRTHEVAPYPVLSVSTPFHRGDVNVEIGFADLEAQGSTGFDIDRIQGIVMWELNLPLTSSLTVQPAIGTGFDYYSNLPWYNPSEIENLVALGFTLEQDLGHFVIAMESRWVRVLSYRRMDSTTLGLTVRYRFDIPERWLHVVR